MSEGNFQFTVPSTATTTNWTTSTTFSSGGPVSGSAPWEKSPLPPSRRIRRYGWRPSLPHPGEAFANVEGLKAKLEVDPRHIIADWIFEQGEEGSCTANAACNHFRYDAYLDGADPGVLSRQWLYYYERHLEGSPPDQDTGAMGHDAYRVARHLGIPAEKTWPYRAGQLTPVPQAAIDAPKWKLAKRYVRAPQSELGIRRILSNDQTLVLGFTVFESFEDSTWWPSGKMPVPIHGERVLGGHEIWVVGYLAAEPDYALVANSWSQKWGLDGFFLMPWRVICDRGLAGDLRTIPRPIT